MRYYIIAGEASGDLHGSNMVNELVKLDAGAVLRGWGGDMMEAAGVKIVKHYRDLAFMGFIEVVRNLPTIFANLKFCKQDILSFKPDVLVLVDYPGFNLRIAEWARAEGLKVVYYISPQVWAWKESRVKKIRLSVDKMLVILPFEKDFYRKWNFEVEYVGHPLIEVVEHSLSQPAEPALARKPIIALLPGSRKQEILQKLPIMLRVADDFPGYQFIVARAPGQEAAFYEALLSSHKNVSIIAGQTYALLKQSAAALVTSGTATLETALFGVPEVVCYKGSNISYQIGKRLIKVKYISLVNLIMDKPVVKELIQQELTVANLRHELDELLHNPQRKEQLKEDYKELRDLLSDAGPASLKAAKAIYGIATHSAAGQ